MQPSKTEITLLIDGWKGTSMNFYKFKNQETRKGEPPKSLSSYCFAGFELSPVEGGVGGDGLRLDVLVLGKR